MKITKFVVLTCACCAMGVASAAEPTLKDQLMEQAEQMALSLLPTNKLNEAAGFFGPVTKKYLPVFEKFTAEYQTGKDKLAVVRTYLPKALEAIEEARKMPVPAAKYEAKKQEYLQMFDKFAAAVRLSMAMLGGEEKK